MTFDLKGSYKMTLYTTPRIPQPDARFDFRIAANKNK